MTFIEVVLTFAAGFGLARLLALGRAHLNADKPNTSTQAPDQASSLSSRMMHLAHELDDFFNATGHPTDLLSNSVFAQGADALARHDVDPADIMAYVQGDNVLLSCLALEAMARHPQAHSWQDQVISHLPHCYAWPLFFALRFLGSCEPSDRIAQTLKQCQPWWPKPPFMPSILRDYVQGCRQDGDPASVAHVLPEMRNDCVTALAEIAENLPGDTGESLRSEIARHRKTHIDSFKLSKVGRFIGQDEGPWLAAFAESNLARLEEIVFAEEPQSTLVCGESGVGKSVAVHALARKQARAGWHFLEIAARDVIAGQSYIGELEARIKDLAEQANLERRVVWVLPNIHEFLFTGRHKHNPSGVLELILPLIEERRILVIGETTPSALERMQRSLPKIGQTFQTCVFEPPTRTAVAEALPRMLTNDANDEATLDADSATELLDLSSQYLADQALPGRAWILLKRTVTRLRKHLSPPFCIRTSDVMETLSAVTGLPVSFFGDSQQLHPEQVHAFFNDRVKGQTEAIDTLVDRIAMIKAGLTDSSRPFGVFLFVGPTGSGKTEIAKALAEFLFGSSQRMIRLDMSEFQNADGLGRILGGSDEFDHRKSLTSQIREQPFSLVLLDEFEKAHARVWDLFLQVFDDGRLTDATGRTADFRYTIVIMTSNLGATLPQGSSIGFDAKDQQFSGFQVQKALNATFRREFVNRIDKIVVFHPLNRTAMRRILEKELAQAFGRRGIRGRPWAIEIEPSAYDFLLDKGFTQDLGARPLKRAIEHHLLAPLARTMVSRDIQGDQFLLVHADGARLTVAFIDPDATLPDVSEPTATPGIAGVAWDPRPTQANLETIDHELERLDALLADHAWDQVKSTLLDAMNESSFWSDPERFRVLGRVELMDRISFSLNGMRSLFGRLKPGTSGGSQVVRRLALTLRHIDIAIGDVLHSRPTDAFLVIDCLDQDAGDWAKQLTAMYKGWSADRGMRWTPLGADEDPISICGFGAYTSLAAECGVHLWEEPRGRKSFRHWRVEVQVLGHPETPFDTDRQALDWIGKQNIGPQNNVVRRYRRDPSPLVRDGINCYRSGKLDRILGGDFDLVPGREPN